VLSRLGVDRVDVAYGDTWMDIPLLEHAEHPVAVYPDEKLKNARKGTRLGDHWRNSLVQLIFTKMVIF
jgi:phosphoserine phosphatase